MRVAKVDHALEACTAHLSGAEDIDPSVENLLTQALLVLICAEFERVYRQLVLSRCATVSDLSVKEYLTSYTATVLRSLRLGDVTHLLSRFGERHKEDFRQRLHAEDDVEAMYSNIVTHRNDVAHGGVTKATLGDVRQFYERGHLVLDYFESALWVAAGKDDRSTTDSGTARG